MVEVGSLEEDAESAFRDAKACWAFSAEDFLAILGRLGWNSGG